MLQHKQEEEFSSELSEGLFPVPSLSFYYSSIPVENVFLYSSNVPGTAAVCQVCCTILTVANVQFHSFELFSEEI